MGGGGEEYMGKMWVSGEELGQEKKEKKKEWCRVGRSEWREGCPPSYYELLLLVCLFLLSINYNILFES